MDLGVAEKRLLEAVDYLKSQGTPIHQILDILDKTLNIKAKEEVKIPLSIFQNDELSSLETIVKYLRDNLLLSYKQIAFLTKRNPIALAVSYRNAKRKHEAKFTEETSPYSFPVTILQNRNLSVLENIVAYLKDKFGLTYHSIAVLLNRNDRTIWTVYHRASKKRKNA